MLLTKDIIIGIEVFEMMCYILCKCNMIVINVDCF